MYPHKYDRYLTIAVLIRHARKARNRNIHQEKLAAAAGVTQGTISILETLADRLPSPAADSRQLVSRETLLRVLGKLSLPIEEANAIAWLFDNNELTVREHGAHLADIGGKTDHPRSTSVTKTDANNPVSVILRMLEHAGYDQESCDAKATILFRSGGHSELLGEEKLLSMEQQRGQRLIAIAKPSILNLPYAQIEKVAPIAQPTLRGYPNIWPKYKKLVRERVNARDADLRAYGERVIHQKTDLETYIARGPYETSIHRQLFERYIELLRDRTCRFELALADTTPTLEMIIKNGHAVVFRGTPTAQHTHHDTKGQVAGTKDIDIHDFWGPRWVFWYDPRLVLTCVSQFENKWWGIPDEDRDREAVARTLELWLGHDRSRTGFKRQATVTADGRPERLAGSTSPRQRNYRKGRRTPPKT